ncbi:hypothetical protein [Streptomyces bacillaris]|uniref:hypothetical protein n=1 Tax=Streptomyces bacillaris TaxID=68179 RepID=UPI00346177A4
MAFAGRTINDALLTELAAEWTPYTATLTGTAIGNGSVQTRYQQVRDRLLLAFTLNWGSGSSGNMPVFSLPKPPAALGGMRWSGALMINRGAGTWRSGVMYLGDSSSTVNTYALYGSNGEVTSNLTTAGITMVAGGWMTGQIEYEVDV